MAEKITISEVRAANPEWFTRKNKRLRGDISYSVGEAKVSGRMYLVRYTYAATNMFGGPKIAHYRLHELNSPIIGDLTKEHFRNVDLLNAWLREN